jgi:hypothetical protein
MRFGLAALVTAWLGAAGAAAPSTPIIVELFTSEGCSSCPPADALLQKLAESQPIGGAQILAMGEHVDYWDHQGWRDRFSSAALTNRQQTYGARFNNASVYTPQMIVDGQVEFVGSDAAAARKALERAAAAPHGRMTLAIEPSSATPASSLRVTITSSDLPRAGRGDRADVLVAVTEDGLTSNVTRGENHGRVLVHAAVVRSLTTVGEASIDGPTTLHADVPLDREWQRSRLRVVGFVQERRGRAILAAAAAAIAQR